MIMKECLFNIKFGAILILLIPIFLVFFGYLILCKTKQINCSLSKLNILTIKYKIAFIVKSIFWVLLLIFYIRFYFCGIEELGLSIPLLTFFSALSITLYLLTEKIPKKKDKGKVDLCIFPVIVIITTGVLSFYIEDASIVPMGILSNNQDYANINNQLINLGSTDKGAFWSYLIPHITACVGFVTFWAFWAQIKANEITNRNFKIQQVEAQFYEMLKVHAKNVKELKVRRNDLFRYTNTNQQKDNNTEIIEGREVFDALKVHYEIIFEKVKEEIRRVIKDKEQKIPINNDVIKNEKSVILWFKLQHHILKNTYHFLYEGNNEYDKYSSYGVKKTNEFDIILKEHFKGHRDILTHYYRHLFQTVKYVVNQDDDMFSYNYKRQMLKMLRAQMNNKEQLMLFYNWFSTYGKQWENEDNNNQFLTNYRMIHNLHTRDLDNTLFIKKEIPIKDSEKGELLLFLFKNLNKILSGSDTEDNQAVYSILQKKKGDSLFEFQDWHDEESQVKINYTIKD